MNVLLCVPDNYKSVGGMYLPIDNYENQLVRLGHSVTVFLMPYHDNNISIKNNFLSYIKNGMIDVLMVYGLNQIDIIRKWLKNTRYTGKKVALMIDSLQLESESVMKETSNIKHIIKLYLQNKLYAKKEQANLCFYDDAVYVSTVDIEYVKSHYSNISSILHYVPNGTKIPKEIHTHAKKEQLVLGCLTGFSKETIENNLKYLIDVIIPDIVAEYPEAEFCIAGRGCPKEFEEYLMTIKNLRFLGFVENLEDFYDNVDVVLTTVKKECGILNRILEAWAYKKVVVGYKRNFATFGDAINGVHFLSAETSADFLSQYKLLKENRELYLSISKASNDLVKNNYTWDAVGYQLQKIIQ